MIRLLLIFFFAGFVSESSGQSNSCEYFNITVVKDTTLLDTGKAKITIHVKGETGKVVYLFGNDKKQPINADNIYGNSISELSKGTYYCFVIDEAGCRKKLSIDLN